jgi:hypothetical protein
MRWATFLPWVAVLGACAPEPSDYWLGEWAVTGVETHRPCGGGDPADFSVDTTWSIEATSVSTFIAGRCRMPLRIISATRAEFAPFECDTTVDGRRVMVEGLDGALTRSGDTFTGTHSLEATVDGSCVTVSSFLDGERL